MINFRYYANAAVILVSMENKAMTNNMPIPETEGFKPNEAFENQFGKLMRVYEN